VNIQMDPKDGISTVKSSPKKNTGNAQAGRLTAERSLRLMASNTN
jgi:hypothetical protein